jgi:hypothetical protein
MLSLDELLHDDESLLKCPKRTQQKFLSAITSSSQGVLFSSRENVKKYDTFSVAQNEYRPLSLFKMHIDVVAFTSLSTRVP